MKKVLISLAAVAVVAILPASASAACSPTTPCSWGGWGQEHSDNLADPDYAVTFGQNGVGNSDYCVGDTPNAANDCSSSNTRVYSPVVFAGVLCAPTGCTAASPGCGNHVTTTGRDGSQNLILPGSSGGLITPGPPAPGGPCNSGNTLGAFYIGTSTTTPDPLNLGLKDRGIIGLQG